MPPDESYNEFWNLGKRIGDGCSKMIPDRSNVIDKRKVKLEDILKKSYIPFGSGRPDRDEIINSDDMCNLKIALVVSSNTDDFIQQV